MLLIQYFEVIFLFKRILIIIIVCIVGYYVVSSVIINRAYANYVTSAGTAPTMAMPLSVFYDHYGLTAFSMYKWYAPLYYISAVTAIKIVGKNWAGMIVLNNGFYLLLLLLFSYMLGKTIKDGFAGIIVVLLVLLYPLTYLGFITVCVDFGLMAFIVAAVYFLVKSAYFKSTKYSIALGAACAMGMLVKNTYAAFIVGPLLVGLIRAVGDLQNKDFKRLGNLLVCAAVGAAIIAPCYGHSYILNNFYEILVSEPTGLKWYSFEKIRPFIIGLSELQLTPAFCIVLVLGGYYFIKEAGGMFAATILSWIIIPNIIMIFMPHWVTSRYFLPLQPAYALISMYFVRRMVMTKHGKVIMVVLCGLGIFQYYEFVYKKVGIESAHIGATRYFCNYSDLNSSNAVRSKNSAMLEGIRQGVLKKMVKNDGKVLLQRHYMIGTILQEGDYKWIDSVLGGYFWFNNINVSIEFSNVIFDTFLPGGQRMPIDYFMYFCATPGAGVRQLFKDNIRIQEAYIGDRGTNVPYSIPFEVIKNNWVSQRTGANDPAVYRRYDWTAIKTAWEQDMSHYKNTGAAIYRDEHYTVYLFEKCIPDQPRPRRSN